MAATLAGVGVAGSACNTNGAQALRMMGRGGGGGASRATCRRRPRHRHRPCPAERRCASSDLHNQAHTLKTDAASATWTNKARCVWGRGRGVPRHKLVARTVVGGVKHAVIVVINITGVTLPIEVGVQLQGTPRVQARNWKGEGVRAGRRGLRGALCRRQSLTLLACAPHPPKRRRTWFAFAVVKQLSFKHMPASNNGARGRRTVGWSRGTGARARQQTMHLLWPARRAQCPCASAQ
jgi:hypothetical protein